MEQETTADQHGAGDQATVGPGAEDGEPLPPEATIERVDLLLDQVERALVRLDDATYGTCESCGGPVEEIRLAAGPATSLCLACAADGGQSADRPAAMAVDPVPTAP